MKLDRDWISRQVPHQGSMCLLERVLDFDAQNLRAAAINHRDPDHPLRAHGRLASICGVEYAAQAMAVHAAAANLQDGRPRAGYLASLRGVRLHAPRLDQVQGELLVKVSRQSGDHTLQLYEFAVEGDGRCLLEGRAAVVLDADALPTSDQAKPR